MKKGRIKLGSEEHEYKIKNNHLSRNVRISVKKDGEIVVTKPRYVAYKTAEKFLNDKRDWLSKTLEKVKVNSITGPKTPKDNLDYKKNKSAAMEFVKNKIEEINKHYNYVINRISIRNQTTRWGSCSKKGNLNFNYKIIYLDEKTAEYVIVHELCHLKELNHSPRFWRLVGEYVPDYKEVRKKLRNMDI